MSNYRKKLGILLVPAYERPEFAHLPVPYFWLPSLVVNKKKIEVIVLNIKSKDDAYDTLSHEVDSLLMTGKSFFVESKITTFNYCHKAIYNEETQPADLTMTQQLKKWGIDITPEEVLFVPTKKKVEV